jgi:ABC-type branched-subunit amino acid transport system permease subunit
MRGHSVDVRWAYVTGAFLGSLAALLVVRIQRPSNTCTGGPEDICTLVLIEPVPPWLWALAALAGALVGIAVAHVRLRRRSRG